MNEEKRKICFLAQFPQPIHGLSKAVDTLYNSKLKDSFELSKINLTNNKKILTNIISTFTNKSDIFYLTIAQSKFGNLRDLILMYIVFMKRKKIIIHLHGGYFRKLYEKELGSIQKFFNRFILKKVSAAIVLGESLKYIFEGLVTEEKIFIVENCVDNEFIISDKDFNNKINTDCEDIKVLYLSNFIKEKGYEEVLKLSLKTKKNDKIKYFFAGLFFSDEDKNRFEKFLSLNDLNNTVKYIGVVNGDKKLQILKKSNIFILPTWYPKEGQPISIIEAMSNGCYIISTNHAGIPDLVEDGINGSLVEVNSIHKIYDEIMKICDFSILNRTAIGNRKKVFERYTEENYINKMISVFSEV